MFLMRYKDVESLLVNFKLTSEVPVEHETLKSGRDATGQRRWKDRREG